MVWGMFSGIFPACFPALRTGEYNDQAQARGKACSHEVGIAKRWSARTRELHLRFLLFQALLAPTHMATITTAWYFSWRLYAFLKQLLSSTASVFSCVTLELFLTWKSLFSNSLWTSWGQQSSNSSFSFSLNCIKPHFLHLWTEGGRICFIWLQAVKRVNRGRKGTWYRFCCRRKTQ